MMGPRARVISNGLVLGAAYVGVLALTMGGKATLPLYDGFAPPPRYQWVKPPAALAAGNKVPRPKRSDVALGPGGSPQQGFTSDDSQLVLNLPAGAVPPAVSATTATLTITPLDAATLGPLPAGANPDGNAYRIDIAYLPDTMPVSTLASPGSAVLTVPQRAEHVFSSPDGKAWAQLELVPVDSSRISFRLAAPGYLLASSAPVAVVPGPPTRTEVGRTLAVGAVTVMVAGVLFLGPPTARRLWRGRPSR